MKPTTRRFIMPAHDTGKTSLQDRLDQLRDGLLDITIKLRSAVANAVGQSLGTVVRDTVLRVLHALQDPVPESNHWNAKDRRGDPFIDDEESGHDLWRGERDNGRYRHDQDYEEDPEEKPESTRLTVAVCAALEATSAARRFLGKQTILTLLGVGLAAGCMAYWTPALAIASIGLVTSASHLSFVRRTVNSLFNS